MIVTQTRRYPEGVVFLAAGLGAGVIIGYLWAVKRCPPPPKADAKPVPETDGKVVQGQFGGSERKERTA